MSDLTPVAVLGGTGEAVALVRALGAAGIETDLIEPEEHTRARLAHLLQSDATGWPVSVRARARTLRYGIAVLPPMQGAEALRQPDSRFVLYSDCHGMPDEGVAVVPTPPVHLRHLDEICPGRDAPEAVLGAARALVGATGRRVVETAPGAGSAVFRLWRALIHRAESLLLEGADPFETDEALGALGWKARLFEAQDLVGLDRLGAIRRSAGDPACLIHDRMVQEGRLGRHAGVGWYRYPGGGGAVVDPLMEDLIREEAHFAAITPVPRPAIEVAAALDRVLRDVAGALRDDAVVRSDAEVALILRDGFGVPVGVGGDAAG